MYVTDIDNGDYIKVRNVDFGKGAKQFIASIAGNPANGAIEIHTGSPKGTLLGTLKIKNTGSPETWSEQSCSIKKTNGVHDLYLVFKGSSNNLLRFDWWKFSK